MIDERTAVSGTAPAVHRIALPRGSVPHVQTGSQIRPDQVLASRREARQALRLPIAGPLGRQPADAAALMLVRPGDRLEPDQPMARGPDGREVRSPGPRDPARLPPSDGTALLVSLGAESPVIGHVAGSVLQVPPQFISVAVPGARLEGIGGMGDAVHGELAVAVHTHDEELRAGAIDVSAAGKILIGGSRASAETLTRARAMGVAGIVLGGILDKELRDFEAIQRRRREIGGMTGSFAVVLLEGYGKVALDAQLFAWLRAHAGRTASLFGEEDLILYIHDAASPPTRAPLATVGDRVVIHRRPFQGRSGVLVGVLDELHQTPAGIPAVTGVVRMEDGRLAPIPLANLEPRWRPAGAPVRPTPETTSRARAPADPAPLPILFAMDHGCGGPAPTITPRPGPGSVGTCVTVSAEETRSLGHAGAAGRAGTLVALVGPLGAGKTVLAKGIADGLGSAQRGEQPHLRPHERAHRSAATVPCRRVSSRRSGGGSRRRPLRRAGGGRRDRHRVGGSARWLAARRAPRPGHRAGSERRRAADACIGRRGVSCASTGGALSPLPT